MTEAIMVDHGVSIHSNLLGGFGAGFITPVNTINWSTVFDDIGQKLVDSAAVWSTMITFANHYDVL